MKILTFFSISIYYKKKKRGLNYKKEIEDLDVFKIKGNHFKLLNQPKN